MSFGGAFKHRLYVKRSKCGQGQCAAHTSKSNCGVETMLTGHLAWGNASALSLKESGDSTDKASEELIGSLSSRSTTTRGTATVAKDPEQN